MHPVPGRVLGAALGLLVLVSLVACAQLLDGHALLSGLADTRRSRIFGDAGLVGSGNSLLGSAMAAARWAPTAIYGSPYVLYGTLGSARDRLLRRRDRLGISYYTVPSHAMESMAPLVEALTGK